METKLWNLQQNKETELHLAASLLRQGEVVAFPTETVYGLGADGLNGAACEKIFAAKGRPMDNPLILHIAEIKAMEAISSNLSNNAKVLMEKFWPGPMTLVVPKSALVPDAVTAGLETVAVRMPDHPIAQELIKLVGRPLAAPSANKSGRPSPTTAAMVYEDMDGRIAGIIDGGSCTIGVESTIVDTTTPIATILRPGGITLEQLEEVLGVVELDPGLVNQGVAPKAPGMKYRHYAPVAPMVLFEGAEAKRKIWPQVEQLAGEGKRIGLIVSQEVAKQGTSTAVKACYTWDSQAQLAQELYSMLIALDHEQVDYIVAEGTEETGLGLAIMNRMRKAAGFNVVK